MAVPLVVILGVFMWMFTTAVKWFIAKDYQYNYQNKIDEETLKNLQRSNMTDEKCKEAWDKFREKQANEEKAGTNKSLGKTFFDEVEDRIKYGNKGRQAGEKQNKPKYTPDMFHDTVSRMHEELMKNKKGKCD